MQLPHMYPQYSLVWRQSPLSEDETTSFWICRGKEPFDTYWEISPDQISSIEDTAQEPSLPSPPKLGGVAASKSPPMLWCSSLGTLHVKCPFMSFPFLSFLFPCLGKALICTGDSILFIWISICKDWEEEVEKAQIAYILYLESTWTNSIELNACFLAICFLGLLSLQLRRPYRPWSQTRRTTHLISHSTKCIAVILVKKHTHFT